MLPVVCWSCSFLAEEVDKDDEDKARLHQHIENLENQIKELITKIEGKHKEEGGETMLVAPENLNPRQQNDGVEELEGSNSNQTQQHPKKAGWKRWV